MEDCVANDLSRFSAYGIDADDEVVPYTSDEIKFMKAWKKALNEQGMAEARAQVKKDREERKRRHGEEDDDPTTEAPAGQQVPEAKTPAKSTENDPAGQRIIVYRLPDKSLSVFAKVIYGELRNIERKTKKNPVYVKQEVLAANWGVTPKTVRTALRQVEKAGLITHQRGAFGSVTCYWIL
jgi:hypothetical protein